MGKDKQNKIRISAMLVILTFILIPLLSSNVSALVMVSAGTAASTNTPSGITFAGSAFTLPATATDPAGTPTASVVFTMAWTFKDTTAGPGSIHELKMTVTWPGGGGGTAGTGPTAIGGNTTFFGTISTATFTNARGTVYTVSVSLSCQDLPLPSTIYYWNASGTCTVN